ncbi:MATE efflux family protein LAL5 [Apostasia shenzhenica]|uniref:Protein DETOXIFICATION n=1 Tax=Apostasia shenzhenica TaxID=1088818 RepID=A0A2H9ZTS1_9ASPA|nr:MATE efflux family protein LAL5 [Apostasia shenzhenica]
MSLSPLIVTGSDELTKDDSRSSDDGGGGGGGGGGWRLGWFVEVEEAKAQAAFSVPMIVSNMSYYGIPLVSVMFAGHLGDLELAGATLGNSWFTVTGIALLIGLSGALETLCGQAYGAKSYNMLGIYLQSSLIISSIFAILVSILWCFTEPLLIWLHQEPQVAAMAALYLRYLIPGLFAYGFIQCMLRFCQTQSVVNPLIFFSLLPLVLHVGLAFLLVRVVGLGFIGTSLSASVSLWVSLIMLATYVTVSKKFEETWGGIRLEAFQHVQSCMRLALPSAVMVCFEYWAFEFLVLLAGLLPNSERSTSLIAMCVNTESISYMITYGFSAAVSTRVSNEIGCGNIKKAKNAVSVTLKLSLFLAATVVLLLGIGHGFWASLFSSNTEIITQFGGMTLLLTLSILFDSAQGVLSGVARGCGWQHLAAWTNLVAFYLIGMPLAFLFAFKMNLMIKGLWLGLICGLGCQASTLLLISLRTKWERIELSLSNTQAHSLV